MKIFEIDTKDLKSISSQLTAGDKVILSGNVYTARDAAHKRVFEMIAKNESLPFELEESVIYYAGPTPTPNNLAIGSCGPTTSSRMDGYAPLLYDKGIIATIGKGERNEAVIEAIKRNNAVYLCAIGGAGALASLCIDSNEVIAFEDLGCESVKRLHFNEFSLIVGIDCKGGNIFEH